METGAFITAKSKALAAMLALLAFAALCFAQPRGTATAQGNAPDDALFADDYDMYAPYGPARGHDIFDIEFDEPAQDRPGLDNISDFMDMTNPQGPDCIPYSIQFNKDYQKKIDAFSARKLMSEQEYFTAPYVDKGKTTPMLEDILFELTRVISPVDLEKIVVSFKRQTAGFPETGAWDEHDVKKAIETQAQFDVCLPIPEYTRDPNPSYKFVMSKTDLMLNLYQIYNGQEILLSSFPTTKGGWSYDAKLERGRGFPTPTGNFFVRRIAYAPRYMHPNWSKTPGHLEGPGFRNSYGIVMAELWKSNQPLCSAADEECNGYAWGYPGDTGIRFHTSSRDTNVRRNGRPRTSHGCNRLFTKDGKRIFTLLYYTVPHAECKKVQRGTLCPFIDTVIPYIVEN